MTKRIFLQLMLIAFIAVAATAQKPAGKAVFKTYEPGYFQNTILKGIESFEIQQKPAPVVKTFKAELPADFPKLNVADFKQYWHNPPISQGNTNTCWSFSTTSFLESDIYRTTGKQVKISEMFTVYCEYIERAKEFVRTRGNIYIGEGSEGNAVTKIWRKYGCVPFEAYSGFLPGQTFYTHDKMFNEIKACTEFVKANNLWDEAAVVANFKAILDYYMGTPPDKVTVNGKEYTPKQYLNDYLKVNPDDYVDVLSYLQQPFWQKVEYEVPDNWWHDKSYYNIPLDDYMQIAKTAIKAGYTFAVGGDVSEAGFLAREANTAFVPDFDIPSQYINDNARQFRFSNQTTTDDHGMHVVGFKEVNGVTWFLVKDSGAGSRTGGKDANPNFGYYFFHEDYIKLKMMDLMIHKDAVKDILSKF